MGRPVITIRMTEAKRQLVHRAAMKAGAGSAQEWLMRLIDQGLELHGMCIDNDEKLTRSWKNADEKK